jgi:hypothetical protein
LIHAVSHRLKHILGLVALLALALAAWRNDSLREKQRSQEAKAEEQAVWIARVWNEGMSIADLREQTAKAAGHPLDLSAWETGDSRWIARGPVVGPRRIVVMRDRSVVWDQPNR